MSQHDHRHIADQIRQSLREGTPSVDVSNVMDEGRLVDRLMGIIVMPINDGAGPLNGQTTFTRVFSAAPPVNVEAAQVIVALMLERQELLKQIEEGKQQ